MRKILVCTKCSVAIFLDSAANRAPRWTGKIGDPPETREEIGGQDDLLEFRRVHQTKTGHKLLVARLV